MHHTMQGDKAFRRLFTCVLRDPRWDWPRAGRKLSRRIGDQLPLFRPPAPCGVPPALDRAFHSLHWKDSFTQLCQDSESILFSKIVEWNYLFQRVVIYINGRIELLIHAHRWDWGCCSRRRLFGRPCKDTASLVAGECVESGECEGSCPAVHPGDVYRTGTLVL